MIFHHTTAVVDTIDREEGSNHSPRVLETGANVGGELGIAWIRHIGRSLGESWEFFGHRIQVRFNPGNLRSKGRPVRIRAIERLWEKGWNRQVVGSTDLRQQSGRRELQGHRRDAEQERRQGYPDRSIVALIRFKSDHGPVLSNLMMDTTGAEGKGTAYAWINTAASIDVAKIAWVAAIDRRTREEMVTDRVIHSLTTIFRQTVLFVLAVHRKVRNARHAR